MSAFRFLCEFFVSVRITRIVQRRYALADPRFRPMSFLQVVAITLKHWR